MLLNAYSILDFFFLNLRLLMGLLVLWCGLLWKRDARRSQSPESLRYPSRQRGSLHTAVGRQSLNSAEDHAYLLYLLSGSTFILSLISWPFFYLVLQSYVPEWPGVMCIYGVTQIGAGSVGISRHLPNLIGVLQVSKPLIVFCAGAWLVFYLANRRTATSALQGQVVTASILLGLVSLADAGVEAAYLLIPKKEEFLAVGCCTNTSNIFPETQKWFSDWWLGESHPNVTWIAYFAISFVIIATLYLFCVGWIKQLTRLRLLILAAFGLASLPINLNFLTNVVSPVVLRLPYHNCPYDLLPRAPECLVGIALFSIGCFSIGWAMCVGWFGRSSETKPFLDEMLRSTLFLGLLGYVGSVVLFGTELALHVFLS